MEGFNRGWQVGVQTLRNRFACIDTIQCRQFFDVVFHQFRPALHHGFALSWRQIRPLATVECAARHGHGRINISCFAIGNVTNQGIVYRCAVFQFVATV